MGREGRREEEKEDEFPHLQMSEVLISVFNINVTECLQTHSLGLLGPQSDT